MLILGLLTSLGFIGFVFAFIKIFIGSTKTHYKLRSLKWIIHSYGKEEKKKIIKDLRIELAKGYSNTQIAKNNISFIFIMNTIINYHFSPSIQSNIKKIDKNTTLKSSNKIYNSVNLFIISFIVIYIFIFIFHVEAFNIFLQALNEKQYLGQSLLGVKWWLTLETYNKGLKFVLSSSLLNSINLQIKFTVLVNIIYWILSFILALIEILSFIIFSNTFSAYILLLLFILLFLPIFRAIEAIEGWTVRESDLATLLIKLIPALAVLPFNFILHANMKTLAYEYASGVACLSHIYSYIQVFALICIVIALYIVLIFGYSKHNWRYKLFEISLFNKKRNFIICMPDIFTALFFICLSICLICGKSYYFVLVNTDLLNFGEETGKMLRYHNILFQTEYNHYYYVLFFLCLYIILFVLIRCTYSKVFHKYYKIKLNNLSTKKKLFLFLFLCCAFQAFFDLFSRFVMYSLTYPIYNIIGLP